MLSPTRPHHLGGYVPMLSNVNHLDRLITMMNDIIPMLSNVNYLDRLVPIMSRIVPLQELCIMMSNVEQLHGKWLHPNGG